MDFTRRITPLWIVVVFVSLAETVIGVALTQTVGTVQLYLTYFVTLFPAGVASAFFLIIYRKAWVFYAPWEYRGPSEIQAFRGDQAKPLDADRLDALLKEKIQNVVADETLAERAVKSIQTGFLTIDSTPLLGAEGTTWRIPHTQFDNVQELLNNIWLSLPREHVRPYSYGKDWILKDANSDKTFRDIGSSSAFARQSPLKRDTRMLEKVDIRPGMHLVVVSPRQLPT